MPLDQEAQKLFTMVTRQGLCTPTRVTRGMLNAMSYFQGTRGDVLKGLLGEIGEIWVDDIAVWSATWLELMEWLRMVLERLMVRGLYAMAHEVQLFRWEIRLCERIYSGESVSEDPECVQVLATMRRPNTVGERIQFL